jgi:UDP-3-O-[3-hydroxymyristoyl] glucosamine N-acyltransferase
VGVVGHLDIPDFVRIGAQSGVMNNPEANTEIVGSPAMEANQVKRIFLQTLKLPELAQRVKELEKQVKKMGAGEETK